MAGVRQSWRAIQCVSDELGNNREIVLAAVQHKGVL